MGVCLVAVLEARFHPNSPDHLFSCGMDGQLVHWDASDAGSLQPQKQGKLLMKTQIALKIIRNDFDFES